jgi:hypothetical protein
MPAVTIPLSLPPSLVVISAEVSAQVDALLERVTVLPPITDMAGQRAAEALHKECRAAFKAIEAGRKAFTAPLDEVKAQAIAAERAATQPLAAAVDHLGKAIADWITAENARREAERKRLEEEARRRQAEEDARAEAERQRLAAQAAFNALPGDAPAEVPATAALPQRVPDPPMPAPIKSTAIRQKTTYRVEVVDATQVPVEVSGIVLRPVDVSAALPLLKAGAKIPGLVLHVEGGIAAKG